MRSDDFETLARRVAGSYETEISLRVSSPNNDFSLGESDVITTPTFDRSNESSEPASYRAGWAFAGASVSVSVGPWFGDIDAMSLTPSAPKYLVLGLLAVGLGVTMWQSLRSAEKSRRSIVNVNEPDLSAVGLTGKALFEANCAACHGLKAAGSEKGPPLVHDIYNSGHHSDAAFFFAAQYGVRQHHWSYGNMPPQTQVSEQQIASIVRYVRELQVANGIGYRSRRM